MVYIQQNRDSDGHIVESEWIPRVEPDSQLNQFSLVSDWNAYKLTIWRFIVSHKLQIDGNAIVSAPMGLYLPRSDKPDNRPRFVTPQQQQVTIAMGGRIPLPILVLFSALWIFDDENPSPSRFRHSFDGSWVDLLYLAALFFTLALSLLAIAKIVNQRVDIRGQVFEGDT